MQNRYMTWVKKTQDDVPSEFKSPEEVREYCTQVLLEELNLKFDDVKLITHYSW